jgi:outer membrane protein assembly factor BamB
VLINPSGQLTRALSAVDGKVLWNGPVTFDYEPFFHAGIVVTGDFIYGMAGNHVTAVRVSDGSVVWKWLLGPYAYPVGITVAGGRVFVAIITQNFLKCFPHCTTGVASPSSVVSLDAATGTVTWRHDVDDASSLAVPAQ